jgi:hypothetical protein
MDSNIHLPKLTCLFSFIQHFDEGMGWVVKLPYVTNERPFRCTSLADFAELISFAGKAITLLCSRCPHTIADGLSRVDIFTTANGDWVVNQFESLEAQYYCKNSAQNSAVQPDQYEAILVRCNQS